MSKETDVAAVAASVKWIESNTPGQDASIPDHPPAVKVINSVLSLRTDYEATTLPRLECFMKKHPEVRQVTELVDFMANYPTPYDFFREEINFNSQRKGNALDGVVKYLCGIIKESSTVSEEEALKQWAISAKPEDCDSLNVKYFNIAGFQWLRILFFADTSKPDTRIHNFLYDILKRKFKSIECVYFIEDVASHLGYSARKVDSLIWKMMSNWPFARLAPDIADAFPNNIKVNKALQFYLKHSERGKK